MNPLSSIAVRCFVTRALLISVLIASMLCEAASDRADQNGFRMAEPGYVFEFPRDHGSHDSFRTEWWYYTGHLQATHGRRFGFQLTFFRRGIDPQSIETLPSRWTINHLYLAHFAISDIDAGQFHYGEKLSREGLGKAGAKTGGLHVWIDRWSVQTSEETPAQHRLQAAQDNFSIDLALSPLKPPVLHGRDGTSRKGEESGQASHYYSLTRLATHGHISINDETFEVSGTSWMDHEFGSADLGRNTVGWDWFSLQLTDGSEVMLYQLRRSDGTADRASSGTMVGADGQTRFLAAADFTVVPLSYWTSPKSKARFPARWRLSCPSVGLEVNIEPLLADQELLTSRSTRVTYWEGAVQASGTARGKTVSGQGYVELTGYAERFSERL